MPGSSNTLILSKAIFTRISAYKNKIAKHPFIIGKYLRIVLSKYLSLDEESFKLHEQPIKALENLSIEIFIDLLIFSKNYGIIQLTNLTNGNTNNKQNTSKKIKSPNWTEEELILLNHISIAFPTIVQDNSYHTNLFVPYPLFSIEEVFYDSFSEAYKNHEIFKNNLLCLLVYIAKTTAKAGKKAFITILDKDIYKSAKEIKKHSTFLNNVHIDDHSNTNATTENSDSLPFNIQPKYRKTHNFFTISPLISPTYLNEASNLTNKSSHVSNLYAIIDPPAPTFWQKHKRMLIISAIISLAILCAIGAIALTLTGFGAIPLMPIMFLFGIKLSASGLLVQASVNAAVSFSYVIAASITGFVAHRVVTGMRKITSLVKNFFTKKNDPVQPPNLLERNSLHINTTNNSTVDITRKIIKTTESEPYPEKNNKIQYGSIHQPMLNPTNPKPKIVEAVWSSTFEAPRVTFLLVSYPERIPSAGTDFDKISTIIDLLQSTLGEKNYRILLGTPDCRPSELAIQIKHKNDNNLLTLTDIDILIDTLENNNLISTADRNNLINQLLDINKLNKSDFEEFIRNKNIPHQGKLIIP